MKVSELKNIINETLMDEVRRTILRESSAFNDGGEPMMTHNQFRDYSEPSYEEFDDYPYPDDNDNMNIQRDFINDTKSIGFYVETFNGREYFIRCKEHEDFMIYFPNDETIEIYDTKNNEQKQEFGYEDAVDYVLKNKDNLLTFDESVRERNREMNIDSQDRINNRAEMGGFNEEVKKGKDVYHIKCEGVPLGTFETEEEAYEALPSYKQKHNGELIVEKGQYDSHESMIDKLDEMNDELEETENMENTEIEPNEGNAFSGALKAAKLKGEKEFKVDGKKYDVKEKEESCEGCGDSYMEEDEELYEGTCEKCGKELCECGSNIYKSKKKTIRLKESELIKLINKMVTESIPGLDAVKKAHSADKETKQHLSDVGNKMKDYASFDGNDNPEFPKSIGKGEKVARKNTEEENEFVEDTRGGTSLNLNYDSEPSKQFKDRLKKALEGDTTTGNSQEYANVIKSDLGKNLAKQAERKNKKEEEKPRYNKEAQPTKSVNESTFKMSNILNQEIEKMKDMVNYNKKTQ